MTDPRPFSWFRLGLWTVPVIGLLLGGLTSLWLGQDGNWDLRNYHWYNAHAYVTGGLAIDVAPAQVATFYNPTLDLPFYWMAQALPATAVGFIMGAVQGLNLLPLYGLCWLMLGGIAPAMACRPRALGALALALVAFFGGGQIALIGTTFYDNVISVLVLGGAWLVAQRASVVWGGPARDAFITVGIAGFLIGCAVGLKQPTLPYAVGFCFAFLLVAGGFWRRMFTSFFFGIGVILGIALFSGHWMLYLWDAYGNPLFPYFNQLFNSPFATPDTFRDDKFIPKGIVDTLLFPLLWVRDPKLVGEILFTDLRVPLAYLLVPVCLIAGFVLRARAGVQAAPSPRPAALYLVVSAIITYLVWLKLFSIYRYLIPLEMLALPVILAALNFVPASPKPRLIAVAAVAALALVTTQPGTWYRIPWTERFVEVQMPEIANPDNTVLIQTGFAPTSFLTTALPPQIPVYRPHSYFLHPDQGPTGLNKKLAAALDAHNGDILWLVAHWEVWTEEHVLTRFGLKADMDGCRPVTSNLDEPMKLCPLTKVGPQALGW